MNGCVMFSYVFSPCTVRLNVYETPDSHGAPGGLPSRRAQQQDAHDGVEGVL